MAILFCAPFDSDVNLCGPIAPTNTRMDINTSIKKFGAGSIEVTSGTSGNLQWNDISTGAPGNEGAIGAWWYIETPKTTGFFQFLLTNDFNDDSWLLIQIDKDGTISPAINMYDSDENLIINEGMSESAFANDTWHYIELNWLWNNGSGITELSVNGTVIASSMAGNTESRSSDANDVTLQVNSDHLVDDFTVYDTVQHTGNFTPPSVPSCVCAAAVVGQVSFGSQMNRFGAGFSR